MCVVVVPGYSGGSVPDLHGVPFSIPKELHLIFSIVCSVYVHPAADVKFFNLLFLP